MSKKLSLPSIILLGLNTIIGSGIFLLPGQVTALVGMWSFVVYGFVTLMVLCIAWCFAKCAALFNRDGGAYLYARHAFGDFVGFQIGMMRWGIGIIAWASLAAGFVTAVSMLWPQSMQEPMHSILILSLVVFLGILNIINFGTMTLLNNVVTVAKLLPLLFFIGAGLFYVKQTTFFEISFPDFQTDSFGAAALIIFYAFGGFESLVVAAGGMANPEKNLPKAVMITVIFCAFLYLSVQIIAAGTLGANLLTSVSPISDVAEMLLGTPGKLAITAAMLISIGGVNIAASMLVPKNGTALASDGMIPTVIAKTNRFGTPYIAILLTVTATGALALSGSFTQLVAISAISRFAQHITTCLAVFVFYKERLSLKQPLSLSLTLLIPFIALCGIFWLILQTPLYQLLIGFSMLIFSLPLYLVRRSHFTPSLPVPEPEAKTT